MKFASTTPDIVSSQRFRARDEKVGRRLPEPMADVLDVLLDLPFLPAGRRITALGLDLE